MIRDAAATLLAFKPGVFTLGRFAVRSTDPLFGPSYSFWSQDQLRIPSTFDELMLGESETAALERFSKTLLNSGDEHHHRRIRIALRRFAESILKHAESPDAIVDYMVSAEALYLSDTQDKDELTFRLGLRAGALLATSDRSASVISGELRAAGALSDRFACLFGGGVNVNALTLLVGRDHLSVGLRHRPGDRAYLSTRDTPSPTLSRAPLTIFFRLRNQRV